MTDTPIRLAVIIASTRAGRFGETVDRWFVTRAQQHDDLKLDVDAADAFVVVTPECNHGYPAALKRAIDAVRVEWPAKPVGFVSYGGLAGGLRAVEQLRQVFAELHAVGIRDTVSFHLAHDQFDSDGRLHNPHAANTAAATLLGQLAWWTRALHTRPRSTVVSRLTGATQEHSHGHGDRLRRVW